MLQLKTHHLCSAFDANRKDERVSPKCSWNTFSIISADDKAHSDKQGPLMAGNGMRATTAGSKGLLWRLNKAQVSDSLTLPHKLKKSRAAPASARNPLSRRVPN